MTSGMLNSDSTWACRVGGREVSVGLFGCGVDVAEVPVPKVEHRRDALVEAVVEAVNGRRDARLVA